MIIFITYGLLACNVSLPPQAQLKDLRALPSIQGSVRQHLKNSTVFASGQWPEREWWKIYHAPELDALIKQALSCNPSIQQIHSRVEAARQETIIARSLLNPLVYFKGTDLDLHSSTTGLFRGFNPTFPLNAYLIDLSLTANYEFDFWAQNHNLLYASIGRARAKQAEAAQVTLITTTALAQVYFAYKANLLRRDLYKELVNIRTGIHQLSTLIAKSALSSALRPWLAAENENEAKKLLASVEEELAVQQHMINILAGRGPDTPLKLNQQLPPLPKRLIIPRTISIDLIARRPDLMAQIWRAKAWAYRTGAAMADFYPNVNLLSLVGLETTKAKTLFNIATLMGYVQPAVNLPVFTAGAIRANINATQAQFNAAVFAYNNLLLQSTREVLDLLSFARSIYKQKQEQVKIVRSAKQRYALTQLRQQQGLDSQFDDYRFHELLIQKQLEDLILLYKQYVASIKLIKALGGGYCQANVPLKRLPEPNTISAHA